jgi:hypothetical protein
MKKVILLSFVLTAIAWSCKKEAGPGGTGSIEGKVYVKFYNYNFTSVIGEYYAQDEDVYIIYGNDSVFNNDAKTSYNGSFRFEYLQKGDYKIYVYSKDTTTLMPSGKLVEIREVKITEKGQNIVLEDIIIAKN